VQFALFHLTPVPGARRQRAPGAYQTRGATKPAGLPGRCRPLSRPS
jgi:hypothetical protein